MKGPSSVWDGVGERKVPGYFRGDSKALISKVVSRKITAVRKK